MIVKLGGDSVGAARITNLYRKFNHVFVSGYILTGAPSVILSHRQGGDDDNSEGSDDDERPAIPQYDVNGYCARFGKVQPGEYPDQIEQGHQVLLYCLQVGQENYDYVKSMWPLANNQTRKLCLSHSSYAVDYQYVGLASCVQVYVPHQQLQEQGPFHY